LVKRLQRIREIKSAAEIIGRRTTPLEILMKVARDNRRPIALRVQAANAAAPYVHRRQPAETIVQAEVAIQGVQIEVMGEFGPDPAQDEPEPLPLPPAAPRALPRPPSDP
jgi:hypothetical protein